MAAVGWKWKIHGRNRVEMENPWPQLGGNGKSMAAIGWEWKTHDRN